MRVNNVILQTVTKVATYIILTFAIYLFLAGHHNPGGGFISGLVITSAITLLVLVYDVKTLLAVFPFDFKALAAVGVLVAVATGMGSFIFGVPFLSHS